MTARKAIATITASVSVIAAAMVVARHTPNRPSAADGPPLNEESVFAKPLIQTRVDRLRNEVTQLLHLKQYEQAKQQCLALVNLRPEDSASHYNLGCTHAMLNDSDAAMVSLTNAVRHGFRFPKFLRDDPDLRSLHQHEDWNALLESAGVPFEQTSKTITVETEAISRGIAVVRESNSVWNPKIGVIRSFFRDERKNVAAVSIATGSDEASQLLRQWQEQGIAAGHAGVFYDNRDRQHSNFKVRSYPQLTAIKYSQDVRRYNLDTGPQSVFLFNGVILGNSSTAVVQGHLWRSQPRLLYCSNQAAQALARQYFGNHLYVYPEHNDYNPNIKRKGAAGDLFPANTPYMIISQGSSYSDQVFLEAVSATLAAFQTETRRLLSQKSALMPCVQMIFRFCNSQVKTPSDYLTGIAHPPVFQGNQVDKVKMVNMAHDMEPDTVPPVAIIEVLKEDSFESGRDYFDMGSRELLFTTPAAVARVCRAVSQKRSMTMSTEKSHDLHQKHLTRHWVVLQGDPDLIKIEPQNDERTVATISVKYHSRRPIRAESQMHSSRVDIGVFVHNGTYYSAPAIISFCWPDNEVRQYGKDGRILSVHYKTRAAGGRYTDPMLVTGRNWKDVYNYDDQNRLLGWDRIHGRQREPFTRSGYLVTKKDKLDRPLEAVNVRYSVEPSGDDLPVLTWHPDTSVVTYKYASNEDRLGTPSEGRPNETPE